MYEITFITKEEKSIDIKDVIEKFGGKIVEINEMGRKKFAFPIKKEDAGYYTSVVFEIDPLKLSQLNKLLILKTEIIRYLIVTKKIAVAKKEEKKIKTEPVKAPKQVETEIPQKTEKEKPATEVIEKPKPPKDKQTDKKEIKEKTEPQTEKEKAEIIPEKPKAIKEPAKKIEKPTPEAPEIEKKEPKDEEDRLKALEEKLEEILKD